MSSSRCNGISYHPGHIHLCRGITAHDAEMTATCSEFGEEGKGNEPCPGWWQCKENAQDDDFVSSSYLGRYAVQPGTST